MCKRKGQLQLSSSEDKTYYKYFFLDSWLKDLKQVVTEVTSSVLQLTQTGKQLTNNNNNSEQQGRKHYVQYLKGKKCKWADCILQQKKKSKIITTIQSFYS